MKLNELESYYFCTPELIVLRKKYFSNMRKIVVVEDIFNNEKLSDSQRLDKVSNMAVNVIDYIYSNEEIKQEFESAYKTSDDFVMGELVVQSIIADIVLEMKLNINILKDKK